MMALLASAAGNWIVKSPDELDLSAPKSRIRTDVSPLTVSLKIIAPRAVIVELLQVVSAKSVNAVVPLVLGSTLVRVFPLAV